MKLTIYLKSDGSGFDVFKSIVGKIRLTSEEASKIHPVLNDIVVANSAETVIYALKNLQAVSKQDKSEITSYFFRKGQQINNYENFIMESIDGEPVQFSILHIHGPYVGHNDIKGAAHRESLSAMIDFVEHIPPREKVGICAIL